MPGGKHENMTAWSPEEDAIILEMHGREGPKWSHIVKRLPGRTVSSVRNRWQRIEKGRKEREAGRPSKNRCHACGLPKRGHVCQAKLGGGPTVVTTNHLSQLPAVLALAGPPPLRRTRSNTSSDNLLELLRSSEPMPQSSLRESSLAVEAQPVPPPRVASTPVGYPEAALPPPPFVGRMPSTSNRSFFENLGAFAFTSDDDARKLLGKLAAETEGPMMPPALKRCASGEASGPPKMTRSNSAYLLEMGVASSSVSSQQQPLAPPAMQPPMVAGQGRLQSSELLEEGLELFSTGNLPNNLPNFSFGQISFDGLGGSSTKSPIELPPNLGQDFTGGAVVVQKHSAANPPPDAPPLGRRVGAHCRLSRLPT